MQASASRAFLNAIKTMRSLQPGASCNTGHKTHTLSPGLGNELMAFCKGTLRMAAGSGPPSAPAPSGGLWRGPGSLTAPNPHPQVSTAIIDPLPREARLKTPNITIEVIHGSLNLEGSKHRSQKPPFSQNSPFPPLTSVSTSSGRE